MRSHIRKRTEDPTSATSGPVGRHRPWVLVLLVLALLGAACSSGSSGDDSPAVAAAEAAEDSLTNTGDLRTIGVLNVADGSATTLQDVVTGDRPVLLWFYAPH